MNNVRVSVIIPVHNTERYLKKCLESVINQTFKDIEIIVINDCSSDGSLQIIKQYRNKDSRIILIDLKTNAGIGFVRNEGLKIAKGKYVTFIDSDDWIANDYVRVLYNKIEKYQYDVVSPNFFEYNENTKMFSDGQQPQCFYNLNISHIRLKQKFLYFEGTHYLRKMFNMQFLKRHNIKFAIDDFEDVLFIWEVLLNTNKFMFIDKKLYYYRTNVKNSFIYNLKEESTFYATMNLALKIKELILSKRHLYEHFKPVLNSFIMNRFLSSAGKISKCFLKEYPDFKKIFFDDEKIKFYSLNTFKSRLKVFLFYLTVKFNVSFVFISKFYNKFNYLNKKVFE